MVDYDNIPDEVKVILEEMRAKSDFPIQVPPPCFKEMQGEILEFDKETGRMVVHFPVLKKFDNAYGIMQGGMVAAAIDNTLGPLSLMIAPPNLTRTMELRFRRPVSADVDHFTVEGQLTKRQGRRLFFEAKAIDPDGKVLTTCKSFHWIIQDD